MSIEDIVDRVLENSEKMADRLEEIIAEEFKDASMVEVIITLESISASMVIAYIKSLMDSGDEKGAEVVLKLYHIIQDAGRKTVAKACRRSVRSVD